jgi:hypothetical protein
MTVKHPQPSRFYNREIGSDLGDVAIVQSCSAGAR